MIRGPAFATERLLLEQIVVNARWLEEAMAEPIVPMFRVGALMKRRDELLRQAEQVIGSADTIYR